MLDPTNTSLGSGVDSTQLWPHGLGNEVIQQGKRIGVLGDEEDGRTSVVTSFLSYPGVHVGLLQDEIKEIAMMLLTRQSTPYTLQEYIESFVNELEARRQEPHVHLLFESMVPAEEHYELVPPMGVGFTAVYFYTHLGTHSHPCS